MSYMDGRVMRYCPLCWLVWENIDAWTDDYASDPGCKCIYNCNLHIELEPGLLLVHGDEVEV